MWSLADLDVSQLSAAGRATLSAVQRIENAAEPREHVLAELGVDEAEFRRRTYALAQEWTQLQGGPESDALKLPPLTAGEYVALRDSIGRHGQRYPILRGPNGIIDGVHRERACLELGIEPIYEDVDEDDAEELQSLAFVVNLARRHLTTEARRGIIKRELLLDPERSDRSIAAKLGFDNKTVASVRRELEQDGEVRKFLTRRSSDGKPQPATKPPREPLSAPAAAPEGSIDVTLRVGAAVAPDLEGGRWIPCNAVRLVQLEPGIYALETR